MRPEVTDFQGRFTFPWAPDSGRLELRHWDLDGRPTVSGLYKPVDITRENRNAILRLEQGGSVRVRVPDEISRPLRHRVYLVSTEEKSPDYLGYRAVYDPISKMFVTRTMRPGCYQLSANVDQRPWRNLEGVTVTVEAGQESTVDLSNRKYLPAPSPPIAWNTVRVVHQGEPVSGAQVWAFSDEFGGTHQGDLTSESGQYRFRTEIGKEVVVVARLPGRLSGWKKTQVVEGGSLLFELSVAKTLRVRLNNVSAERAPSSCLHLRMPNVSPLESKAIFSLLGLNVSGDFDDYDDDEVFGWLNQDGPVTWIVEDLPARRSYLVAVDRAEDSRGIDEDRSFHPALHATQTVYFSEEEPCGKTIVFDVPAKVGARKDLGGGNELGMDDPVGGAVPVLDAMGNPISPFSGSGDRNDKSVPVLDAMGNPIRALGLPAPSVIIPSAKK